MSNAGGVEREAGGIRITVCPKTRIANVVAGLHWQTTEGGHEIEPSKEGYKKGQPASVGTRMSQKKTRGKTREPEP